MGYSPQTQNRTTGKRQGNYPTPKKGPGFAGIALLLVFILGSVAILLSNKPALQQESAKATQPATASAAVQTPNAQTNVLPTAQKVVVVTSPGTFVDTLNVPMKAPREEMAKSIQAALVEQVVPLLSGFTPEETTNALINHANNIVYAPYSISDKETVKAVLKSNAAWLIEAASGTDENSQQAEAVRRSLFDAFLNKASDNAELGKMEVLANNLSSAEYLIGSPEENQQFGDTTASISEKLAVEIENNRKLQEQINGLQSSIGSTGNPEGIIVLPSPTAQPEEKASEDEVVQEQPTSSTVTLPEEATNQTGQEQHQPEHAQNTLTNPQEAPKDNTATSPENAQEPMQEVQSSASVGQAESVMEVPDPINMSEPPTAAALGNPMIPIAGFQFSADAIITSMQRLWELLAQGSITPTTWTVVYRSEAKLFPIGKVPALLNPLMIRTVMVRTDSLAEALPQMDPSCKEFLTSSGTSLSFIGETACADYFEGVFMEYPKSKDGKFLLQIKGDINLDAFHHGQNGKIDQIHSIWFFHSPLTVGKKVSTKTMPELLLGK